MMQIVTQTRQRSGWPVQRTLATLGVPKSVFYASHRRENLHDHGGVPNRVHELLPGERAAICAFALQHPRVGFCKLTSTPTPLAWVKARFIAC